MVKKERKKVLKLKATLQIPYFSYGTKEKDRKAENQIRKYIKEAINGLYVSLYVEKDGDSSIEDATGRVSVKFL